MRPSANDPRTPAEQRALLDAARNGSDEARSFLSEHFRPTLVAHLERRMGARLARYADAEDLAQEAMTRGLRGLTALPQGTLFEDFRGILLQNANWVLRDRGTQAQRFLAESIAHGGSEDLLPEPAARPASTGPVTLQDEALWLRALLESLDEKYASVLALQLEGKSHRQIADALEISEEAARKRAQRALELLRLRAETERKKRKGN